ncbi:MAG TPA: aminoglycoside phosphotransferase family protein [Thermomicrobiales bacterium]|nr:aminoglycoside phosphotransferase family protein [Thermomicrobiales bacterium]
MGTLPPTVRAYLRAAHGEPHAVERLGGMGGGRVYRVRCPGRTVVVKGAARAAEALFYREVAPALAARGVVAPALEWDGEDAGGWWLVLEALPWPLPRERWAADPELLAILRRLHAADVAPIPAALAPYRPAWTPPMDELALSLFPADTAARLAPTLAALREAHQHLFAPAGALSGDPNPANWGLRDDGTLVLYDWERYCRGAPALDLAITVPGLGNEPAYRLVAARYLASGPVPATEAPDPLARDIRAAKAWSVVEFLSHAAEGQLRAENTIAWLVRQFPTWLGELIVGSW